MIQSCGVTIAIPAADIEGNAREDVRAYLRDVVAHLEVAVRRHTGDAKPKGAPTFQLDGPHDDPLQGRIYVASYAVPVDTDDLPVDCTAYEAFHSQRRAVEGIISISGDEPEGSEQP